MTLSKRNADSGRIGVIGIVFRAANWIFDPYHPERHYMRGPGPKWHKKHAGKTSV